MLPQIYGLPPSESDGSELEPMLDAAADDQPCQPPAPDADSGMPVPRFQGKASSAPERLQPSMPGWALQSSPDAAAGGPPRAVSSSVDSERGLAAGGATGASGSADLPGLTAAAFHVVASGEESMADFLASAPQPDSPSMLPAFNMTSRRSRPTSAAVGAAAASAPPRCSPQPQQQHQPPGAGAASRPLERRAPQVDSPEVVALPESRFARQAPGRVQAPIEPSSFGGFVSQLVSILHGEEKRLGSIIKETSLSGQTSWDSDAVCHDREASGLCRRTVGQASFKCPSVGSAEHEQGSCMPCIFFRYRLCRKGSDCLFCHLPHRSYRVQPSSQGMRRCAQVKAAEALVS